MELLVNLQSRVTASDFCGASLLAEQKIDVVMGRAAHMSKRSREAAGLRMRLCRRRKMASSPHEQKELRSSEFANAALQEKKDGEQPA